MNSKLFVFKMLNKISIKEAIEENNDKSSSGFGGDTDGQEATETTNEPELTEPVNDFGSSGFGGENDIPEEEVTGNDIEDQTNQGEAADGDKSQEADLSSGDEEKDKSQEEKEKNPSDEAVDEFTELSEQTEDPYDLLKFFKAKFTDLEPDDFNKFLSKIVKDKDFRHKPEIKDALLKLKIFFAS